MKGIREIKSRIKSVQSTSLITRAMQLVAASKMKRAQDFAKNARGYSIMLAEILASLLQYSEDITHPFLEEREVKRRGILVISTDKGLCGSLNANLFRLITPIDANAKFVSIGRKAKQYLARIKRDLVADFSVSDSCNFAEVRVAAEFMVNQYLKGEIDTIEVLYPRFKNTLVQTPYLQKILPLNTLQEELEALHQRLEGEDANRHIQDPRTTMLFEPKPEDLLAQLPDMYVKQEIFQMVLEAKASEQSARMVAMKAATDNANDLIGSLKLEYNKARQAAITQEILEIAAATAQSTN